MTLYNLDKFTKTLIKKTVSNNSVVIDATCGNGNDTFYLAPLVKKVYAFDIQEEAINNTQNRCNDFSNIEYICESHDTFLDHINCPIDLIIYNLGYLPNSNTLEITTNSNSTIKSIESGLDLLNKHKLMIITLYTGHDEGMEANSVSSYLNTLDNKKYLVMKYQFCNLNNPPYIMVIEKK